MYYKTQKLGELLANEGYLVYCGGGKGVMEAIAKGVHNKKGICIYSGSRSATKAPEETDPAIM